MTDKLLYGANAQGKPIASVLIGQKYVIAPDGQCHPDTSAFEFQEKTEFSDDEDGSLKRDTDMVKWKGYTDLVVKGFARSATPLPFIDVLLQCRGENTNFEYTIRVHGDRRIEKGRDGLQISEAPPITKMPLTYQKAFGGNDPTSDINLRDSESAENYTRRVFGNREGVKQLLLDGLAYPRNGVGKGFVASGKLPMDMPWPNAEFVNDMLTLEKAAFGKDRWWKMPFPASFDWFSYMWFPRIAHMGFWLDLDRNIQPEVSLGIIPMDWHETPVFERRDARVTQGAHPFLSRYRLTGNENICIRGMWKEQPQIDIALPFCRPSVFMSVAGETEKEVEAVLDTVFVETESMSLSMVWRASTRIAMKPASGYNPVEYRLA